MKLTGLLMLCCILYACYKPAPSPQVHSAVTGFIIHNIKKGTHFSDKSEYRKTNFRQLHFEVSFDSTAIYQTILADNQEDINKLYGFSDQDSHHHSYSARFGWRWSKNALRLFAYVYVDGKLSSKEISEIEINKNYRCSIIVNPKMYLFKVNEKLVEMPRHGGDTLAVGYQLYPYFGGDEPAPHDIRIRIKQL